MPESSRPRPNAAVIQTGVHANDPHGNAELIVQPKKARLITPREQRVKGRAPRRYWSTLGERMPDHAAFPKQQAPNLRFRRGAERAQDPEFAGTSSGLPNVVRPRKMLTIATRTVIVPVGRRSQQRSGRRFRRCESVEYRLSRWKIRHRAEMLSECVRDNFRLGIFFLKRGEVILTRNSCQNLQKFSVSGRRFPGPACSRKKRPRSGKGVDALR